LLEQPKQLSSHPGANMRWKRIALFLARYPQLYHVSLCSDSETVLRLGLLSAASVLDSVGASASLRKTLQQSQRKSVIHVSHPVHGALFLNDQLPLPASVLVRNAMRKPVPRSVASFQSLAVYPLAERARQRGWKRAAVELSIRRDHLTIRSAVEQIEAL
jgi:hypothetical protein